MTAALVPELIVSDITQGRRFYLDVLGFEVRYERVEERFVYLEREGAELMLEQPTRRQFLVGELEQPYGRGMNLQIEVSDVDALYERVCASGASVPVPLEERWYRRDAELLGVRQFVMLDPDGYLLRFAEDFGTKPAS